MTISEDSFMPSQNAARYYKKYTKLKTARSILTEQIEKAAEELSYLESVEEAMARVENEEDILGIRLGELKFRDIGTVLWKELRTAVLAGLCLAAVCFVKIWLVDRMLFGNTDITLMVDLVVCSALALTVVIAKLVGGALPMIAKALGADPAVMASPFITTIVDAVSLLVYFLFANMLLGI